MKSTLSPLPLAKIENLILTIRGQKVMLDSDLADIYGVTTKRLNEQLKRNKERFPEDFVFQLTENELESLRSQFATSKIGEVGASFLPLCPEPLQRQFFFLTHYLCV